MQTDIFRTKITTPPMSRAELEARAHALAYKQRVHIFAVPGRPGVYVTRSKSSPRVRHSLVARDGEIACSCPGFAYRKSCKHAEALRNRLARESTRDRQAHLPLSA